ncbi:MAG: type IV pilus assembly protein PilM [Deltaproteobacteria bacterium]|nr:type IV pilus assembly protein PilM [Deltaproteobacteria bacterium]MBW2594419.1 type IV pilus assembly protein PilM [Deltaproteobacteria bacterium]MBW2649735.1 type IV pilus assembly protein PilM [Deltaproteobacteria bacterium]
MFSVRNLLPGSRKIAGIDIGSSLIKLVELRYASGGYMLHKFAQVPLERGVIESGLVKDHDALVRKIKELFKVSGCGAGNVVTALSGHVVMIKKSGFRKMEEEELRDLIIDDAGEYMPFDDIKDVHFDFHICSERGLNPDQMEVIIAAAKRDIAESYVHAIEGAGRKVAIIDVDSFALETAYGENYDFEADDTIALVNIGASMTNINIVKDEESVFTRNILLGGDSITQALQEKLDVSFEEAEMIKVEGSDKHDNTQEEFLSYLEPVFLEIGRSFDYFSSTAGESNISRILVSGGCAGIPDIVDAMKNKFFCEVEIFNPFKNIACDKNTFSSSYMKDIGPGAAVGVGLALRGAENI